MPDEEGLRRAYMLANPLTENANNNNGTVQSNGDGISTKVEEYVANVHGCLDQVWPLTELFSVSFL